MVEDSKYLNDLRKRNVRPKNMEQSLLRHCKRCVG